MSFEEKIDRRRNRKSLLKETEHQLYENVGYNINLESKYKNLKDLVWYNEELQIQSKKTKILILRYLRINLSNY